MKALKRASWSASSASSRFLVMRCALWISFRPRGWHSAPKASACPCFAAATKACSHIVGVSPGFTYATVIRACAHGSSTPECRERGSRTLLLGPDRHSRSEPLQARPEENLEKTKKTRRSAPGRRSFFFFVLFFF